MGKINEKNIFINHLLMSGSLVKDRQISPHIKTYQHNS